MFKQSGCQINGFVAITAPLNGVVVSGPVLVSATATGTSGSKDLTMSDIWLFPLDHTVPEQVLVNTHKGVPTLSVTWDTAAVPNGSYNIGARAIVNNNCEATAVITVTVQN